MSSDTATTTQTMQQIKTPSMWRVILWNDEFTPMDFVVAVLMQIFNKSHEDAVRMMLTVHETGRACVGLFTREIAQTKVRQTTLAAETHQHPLLASCEEA